MLKVCHPWMTTSSKTISRTLSTWIRYSVCNSPSSSNQSCMTTIKELQLSNNSLRIWLRWVNRLWCNSSLSLKEDWLSNSKLKTTCEDSENWIINPYATSLWIQTPRLNCQKISLVTILDTIKMINFTIVSSTSYLQFIHRNNWYLLHIFKT